MTFSGFTLVAWALWGFPTLLRHLGGSTPRCARLGLLQTAPVLLAIPLASLSFVPSLPWMVIILGLKSIAATNAFTPAITLVNTESPKEELGAVNGVGQTAAAFVRGLGPALAGVMWALSIKLFEWMGGSGSGSGDGSTSVRVAGHQFLPFVVVAVIAWATVPIYTRLKYQPLEMVDDGVV